MRPYYDCRKIFSEEQENSLAEYLVTASRMFYGLTSLECRRLAFEMAKVNTIPCPPKWANEEAAGIEWYKGFMKRHPRLSLRSPEGCSLSRATSFNPHNVAVFFSNLKAIMQREPKFAESTRIFNLDETGTTTVHNPSKIFAEKGVKQVSKCTRDLTTTCCTVSASGNSIPPAMIFPRVHFNEHMRHDAPTGTLGLANKSGRMNSELFSEVMDHYIHHTNSSKDNPSLLIYDNHESHLSLQVIDKAKENGVTILTLPPHSSNKMQPLDVGIFKPFKTYCSQAMDSWMMQNPGKPISIYEIAYCVGIAHEKAMTPSNITAGFRKSGIYPFDEADFTEADFLGCAVTDRPLPEATSDEEELPTPAEEAQPHTSTSKTPAKEIEPEQGTSMSSTPSVQRCLSPGSFRGFPKAPMRKEKSKGRTKGKRIIATDTPERTAIALKKTATGSSQKRKKTQKKQPPAKRRPHDEQNVVNSESSSDTDKDEESILQDTDDNDEDVIQVFNPADDFEGEATEGDYVLTEYTTEKKKKVHYIGKVLREKDKSGDYEISFLKRSQKMVGKFVMPPVPKIEIANEDVIKMILPRPTWFGSTKRQLSQYSFEVQFGLH
ncbi:uncharacterized protein LOC135496524 [Lineus longissimus]|uniref:uncharacterized protein LOC135496524 n=1 Tax=Lineus longissimus TaxID=88925 RepID=UPI00315CB971